MKWSCLSRTPHTATTFDFSFATHRNDKRKFYFLLHCKIIRIAHSVQLLVYELYNRGFVVQFRRKI